MSMEMAFLENKTAHSLQPYQKVFCDVEQNSPFCPIRSFIGETKINELRSRGRWEMDILVSPTPGITTYHLQLLPKQGKRVKKVGAKGPNRPERLVS